MKSERHIKHGPEGTYVNITHFSSEEAEQKSLGWLVFGNHGGDINKTNYFDSPMGSAGMYYMSTNAGVVRLLIPDTEVHQLSEMTTGKLCVLTSGIFAGQPSVEVMFDDGTDTPFVLYLSTDQSDFRVGSDRARKTLTAWTRSGKVGEWPAYQRVGKQLPNLQPWK